MNLKESQEVALKLFGNTIATSDLKSVDEITEQAVKQYKQQGYLIVENFLTEKEIQDGLDGIMDIIYKKIKGPQIQYYIPENQICNEENPEFAVRKLSRFIDYCEPLRKIAESKKLRGVVELLLGEEALLTDPIALLKPPKYGLEKPWHQDMAYGVTAFNKPLLGAWIALDEAGLDNGCMHIIPGSHMDGGVPHYTIRDWQVCDDNVQVEKSIAVPLKPGSIILFHGLLLHATPPNISNKRRRSMQLHFVSKSAAKLSREEYSRMFTNELSGAEC